MGLALLWPPALPALIFISNTAAGVVGLVVLSKFELHLRVPPGAA